MSDAVVNASRIARLRIAIVGGRGLPSTYGGTETFVSEVAPRLAERGHDVTVYCRKSLFKDRPSTYRGVHLVYTPSIETKSLGTLTHTFFSMFDLVRREFDAVLITNVANALHCMIPRLAGKHCALNVDGIEWRRGKWNAFGKAYFYLSARLCGKILPRGIVTDAYAMRQLYMDQFNTPSACIAYGANIDSSTNPAVLRRYGLQPRKYYLIVGRLVPENNADLMLEGFKRSQIQRPLVIVGDANYKSRFVEELKKSAGTQVLFLGHISDSQHLRELFCNAYAYLHGHTVGGTNPALLQALGSGNCILAHANSFNREVLNSHGMLFHDADDLAAKISLIDNDPSLAASYRRRAPERIRAVYTWDRITDQYEELFHQLAAGEDVTQVHSSVRQDAPEPDLQPQ